MSKNILFASRILVTMLVAGLLSTVLGVILMFILANLRMSNEDSLNMSNAFIYVVFGLATGYRLNDLVRQHKKS